MPAEAELAAAAYLHDLVATARDRFGVVGPDVGKADTVGKLRVALHDADVEVVKGHVVTTAHLDRPGGTFELYRAERVDHPIHVVRGADLRIASMIMRPAM